MKGKVNDCSGFEIAIEAESSSANEEARAAFVGEIISLNIP